MSIKLAYPLHRAKFALFHIKKMLIIAVLEKQWVCLLEVQTSIAKTTAYNDISKKNSFFLGRLLGRIKLTFVLCGNFFLLFTSSGIVSEILLDKFLYCQAKGSNHGPLWNIFQLFWRGNVLIEDMQFAEISNLIKMA